MIELSQFKTTKDYNRHRSMYRHLCFVDISTRLKQFFIYSAGIVIAANQGYQMARYIVDGLYGFIKFRHETMV
jgi:hypothetical protein